MSYLSIYRIFVLFVFFISFHVIYTLYCNILCSFCVCACVHYTDAQICINSISVVVFGYKYIYH